MDDSSGRAVGGESTWSSKSGSGCSDKAGEKLGKQLEVVSCLV